MYKSCQRTTSKSSDSFKATEKPFPVQKTDGEKQDVNQAHGLGSWDDA